MSVQKAHDLLGRDLLLEGPFDFVPSKFAVQHVGKVDLGLDKKFEDFFIQSVRCVGVDSIVGLNDYKLVIAAQSVGILSRFAVSSVSEQE